MIPISLLIQVVICTSVQSIIRNESAGGTTQSSLQPPPVRRPNLRHPNWQSLLKDATFQTLIKHTKFTPSLEQKMETDRLLWEKLQTARFLRKQGKSENNVKMGVLIDMTPDGGTLEFRQGDKLLYNCPERKCDQIYNRLLAVWKMQRFEPNDIWIKVKVPKDSSREDVYEYTPKLGLKEMNLGTQKAKGKPTIKQSAIKTPDDVGIIVLDERRETSRQDRMLDAEEFLRGLFKIPTYHQAAKHPYSLLRGGNGYVPHIIGLAVPPGGFSKDNWQKSGRSSTYYQVSPVSFVGEFQREIYDGFMPSLGPTGSPYTTQTIKFSEVYPKHITEPFKEPVKDKPFEVTTPSNFKPSAQLIQYSELDPFFHDESTESQDGIITTAKGEDETVEYADSKELEESSEPTTSDEEEPHEFTASLDIQVGGNTTEVNEAEPTASTINVLRVTEKNGGKIFTTNNIIKLRSTTQRPKFKNKLLFKNPTQYTSAEAYDYAPLYAKWGEKIKTNKTKPEIKWQRPILTTTTTTTTTTTSTTTRRPLIIITPNPAPPTTTTSTPAPQTPPLTPANTTPQTLVSKNVVIENFVSKSPEDIVNTLTNIGVKNSSRIEGYPEISREAIENSTRLIDKMMKNDQIVSQSDPISVIINRISQSYSYKRGDGKIQNFRKIY